MTTQTILETLVLKRCPVCSVLYGIPEDMDTLKRERGGNWFCPNGHSLVFIETEVQRLQKVLTRETHLREQAEAFARDQSQRREQVERSLRATKAVVTRTKRRIMKGVCPCCKRYFADLHRHMSGQHPEYGADVASEA